MSFGLLSLLMYNQLASKDSVNKTIDGLKSRGYEVSLVKNGKEALEEIKNTIPKDVSVKNGASVTLEQIGYTSLVDSEKQEWNDLGANVKKENDKEKRAKLRRDSSISDYYVGSVHALTEDGEFVIASNTGSQLPNIVFTSQNLIFVVSTKKIVPTLSDAMDRLEKHVVPLEDEHMIGLYGSGTALNKIVIFKGEAPMIGRKIKFILINEDLGF